MSGVTRGPLKPAGKIGTAARTAKVLTDPNISGSEKAVEGAAVGAQAAATVIGTVAGSPVLGKAAGVAAGAAVRSKTGRKVITVVAVVLVLILAMVTLMVAFTVQAASVLLVTGEEEPAPQTTGSCRPTVGVDGTLTVEQQTNATAIVTTVTGRELGAGDAVIAIMTALTESTLSNVNYGDLAGPDSRGLFQQRDSWGPIEVRMDPAGAAGLFLDRLTGSRLRLYRTQTLVNGAVDSRGTHPPWLVAQSVQISAFPNGSNYKAQYPRAVGVVTAMLGQDAMVDAHTERWADQSDIPPAGTSPVNAGLPCTPSPGQVSADGWTNPLPGSQIISVFGNRTPIFGSSSQHTGIDLPSPAGTPILAAADGVVTNVNCDFWRGRSPCNILVDHGTDDAGQRVATLYVHMFPSGVVVDVGDRVTAGDRIADVGSNGNSTGPHLHFEVWLDELAIEPRAYMADHGVPISCRTGLC